MNCQFFFQNMIFISGCLLFACSLGNKEIASAPQEDTFSYRRVYTSGNEYRYVMHKKNIKDGQLVDEAEAISVHKVLQNTEQIAFEKLVYLQNGKTEDLSSEIRSFPAYMVSLVHSEQENSLPLPSLTGWDMRVVGFVTDLHTFLVAVSPQAGSNRLTRPGDSYRLPTAPIASWANGDNIPVGEDCIQITVSLKQLEAETVVFETSFTPPETPCLSLLAPFMETPISNDLPNNFQQKMRAESRYHIMWGQESFTVISTVRRSDGIILSAQMENDLILRLKTDCDEALSNCTYELPLRLRRELTLQLVPKS